MAQTDHRQATAQRNVAAILDACEVLVGRGDALTIAALAAESGVSRVTVYAHFDSVGAVVEASARRSVAQVVAALAPVDLAEGSGLDALGRVIDAAWQAVGHFDGMARATGTLLPPEVRREAHREVLDVFDGLIARGRRDGSMRTDDPAGWQSSVVYALIHTAVDDVNLGRLEPAAAHAALGRTLRAALAA